MKRLFCLLLAVCMTLSMAACAGGSDAETTAAPTTTVSPYAGIVADPTTWYEEMMSIPVANSSMTTDELRDICVRQFKANLGFTWTPNTPLKFTYSLLDKTREIDLPVGIAYSGLCYAAGNKDGATIGNVFKVLPYYDKETGVVDVVAMGDDAMSILSSACAYGAQNAWNRVSNSHNLGSMDSFTIYDSNIVLVGPYTYEPYIYDYDFLGDGRTATKKIIQHNGMDVMCQSLAAMLPADGLYSTTSYHVMMCSSKPEVVYTADGVIDPTQSYMLVCEQAAAGTQGNVENIMQSNGVALRPLGTIDRKVTFMELLEKNYIPFTFKEFIGEDPVEEGKAWIGSKISEIPNGDPMTLSDLANKKLLGNYNIVSVIVKVKDPSGNELVSYDPCLWTSPKPNSLELSLKDAIVEDKLTPYADGKNFIHIYAQLSNGELLEAFNTLLVK